METMTAENVLDKNTIGYFAQDFTEKHNGEMSAVRISILKSMDEYAQLYHHQQIENSEVPTNAKIKEWIDENVGFSNRPTFVNVHEIAEWMRDQCLPVIAKYKEEILNEKYNYRLNYVAFESEKKKLNARIAELEQQIANGGGKFNCSFCDKKYNDEDSLEFHVNQFHNEIYIRRAK